MRSHPTLLRLLLSVGFPMLLVFTLISACGGGTGSQGQQQLTPMTLALDWTPNTNHTGIYVALAKNWYRDQGIDLKLLPYSASISPDTLVATGKADVGIGFTESVVADAAVGQPVVSIAAIIQHNTSALVTLASSGITRPRDLDGKVYGGFGAPYENAVVGQVIKDDGGKGTFKNVTLNVDAM
ncbi:MAG TPA: ABC transporter substrate-binding protein, partial [Ktedonobacteraceae bacterium]|nr:ABC transporter substrate-binding protein [Ktedonobacteraceae bacterium]